MTKKKVKRLFWALLIALGGFIGSFCLSLYCLPKLPNPHLRTLLWGAPTPRTFASQKKEAFKGLTAYENYRGPVTMPDDIFIQQGMAALPRGVTANFDKISAHLYKTPEGAILYGRLRFKKRMPDIIRSDINRYKPRKIFYEVIPIHQSDGRIKMTVISDANGLLFNELYGLDRLAKHPDKPVLIVEGEWAADVAQELYPQFVVISAPSGLFSRLDVAQWQSLKNRVVVLWPDADKLGYYGAAQIKKIVNAQEKTGVAIVDVPRHWPLSWDLGSALPVGVAQEEIDTLLDKALERAKQAKASKKERQHDRS